MDVSSIDGLRDVLRRNLVNVTFDKVNGESRTMKCTLKDDVIPKVTQERSTPEDLVTVYDVDKDGWRSFYFMRVRSVEVLI